MYREGESNVARNLLFLGTVCVAICATPCLAQAENHAPVCGAKTLTITDPPAEAAIMEVNPILIGPACSDEDGDNLTLTAVSSPATLLLNKQGHSRNLMRVVNNLAVNASVSITFTVSDGNGGSTQSSVTVVRKDPNS